MDPNVVLNAFTPSEYDIILSYLAPQCKVRQYKEETLLSCQFCQAPGQFRDGLKKRFFRNYFQTPERPKTNHIQGTFSNLFGIIAPRNDQI